MNLKLKEMCYVNIFDNKKVLGRIKDTYFIGEVITINLVTKKVMLDNDGEQRIEKISDVEFLREAFVLHDTIIFDKDVLGDVHGNMYMVELHENDEVTFHMLNENLETVKVGERIKITDDRISELENIVDLVGNIYELRAGLPKEPRFNFAVVKDFNGKHYTYFFALNNKEEKVIDLIKVNTLIGDEEHKRITLSYEDYTEAIECGIYKEVSDQEFDNYLTGFTYSQGDSEEVSVACGVNCGCNLFCEQKTKSEQEETDKTNKSNETVNPDDNKCKLCGRNLDKCYCSLWD